ncbi:MAG: hypothetical protein J3R72DRAFT_454040 [Linnemannia gamsii]|nr:MAG: hypothetical protein J3R72DRAFT_454040 [Linnemannia gamsii]
MPPTTTTTTTATMTITAIFNLPPVLDTVCQHIYSRDIETCRLVCQEWTTLFDIYRWRDIYFDKPDDSPGPSPAAIRRNSSRVRNLNICLDQLSDLLKQQQQHQQQQQLPSPSSPSSLSSSDQDIFPNLRYLCLRSGDYHDDSAAVNRTFKFIVTTTRQLLGLSLYRIITDSTHEFDYTLINPGFATHPTLTVLSLTGEMFRSDPLLTLALLKNCPPSLERLDMCCICPYDKDDRFKVATRTVAESEKLYQWKRFESLKSLSISCNYNDGGCESWVHMPLLKHAPQVKVLSVFSFNPRGEAGLNSFQRILDTATKYCPKIKRLHINPGVNPLMAADLIRVIKAYPKGLEFLIISIPTRKQEQILEAVLQTSRLTLQSLYLEYGAFTPVSIQEETIHELIQECPELQELQVDCTCERYLFDSCGQPCIHHGFQTFVQERGLEPFSSFNVY